MAFQLRWPISFQAKKEEVIAARGKKPDMKEITPIGAYLRTYMKYISDPDKILKTKSGGKGREIYDKMMDDDGHLKACLNTRKLAVVNLGYDILPYVEHGAEDATENDIRVAATVEQILSEAHDFENDMKEILNAYQYGFSVGEILWMIKNGFIMIDDIKARKPDYFTFDKDYNLVYTEQAGKELPLDNEKFVIYTFDPRNENPYGTSLLRNCYWAVWFKSNMIKFLMLFSERFGNPAIYGKYPTGWSENEIDKLVEQLESIHANAVGAINSDAEIQIIESMRKEADFVSGLQFFNAEISKAILGQTLTTQEGKSGSYSLGQVHAGVRDDYVAADCRDLQRICQKQVVNRIVYYNFPEGTPPPRFVIPYKGAEDLEKKAKTYESLYRMKVEFPKEHIHKTFDIPMPQEGEDTYGGASASTPSPFGSPGMQYSDKQRLKRFGGYVGKMPPVNAKTYDMAKSLYFYDELSAAIRRAFAEVQRNLSINLSPTSPLYGLIDQSVRLALDESFEYQVAHLTGDTITRTAEGFALQFGLGKIERALSRATFEQIKNDYLTNNFYAKGTIRNIGNTMRNLLTNKLPEWRQIGFDVGEMKSLLQKTFTELADWKTHQIVQTELNNAAHHAAFEMIDKTGLEYEAWFLVDPASCDICQDWASRNPYTVAQARSMGLPHIQCNDQWSFTLKEAR